MIYLCLAIVAVTSYLLGSLSFSVISSKLLGKGDLREKGSGNAGLTNAVRTGGAGVAVLTLVGDVSKGVGAVHLAKLLMECLSAGSNVYLGMYTAMICVMMGHIFPVFFGFRGGKGVLTTASAIAAVDWRVFSVVILVFLIVFLIKGIVSVASVSAALVLPVVTVVFTYTSFNYSVFFAFAVSATIIISHSSNIERLVNGEEKKLFHKKEKSQ